MMPAAAFNKSGWGTPPKVIISLIIFLLPEPEAGSKQLQYRGPARAVQAGDRLFPSRVLTMSPHTVI
jgi:hypothetical protein